MHRDLGIRERVEEVGGCVNVFDDIARLGATLLTEGGREALEQLRASLMPTVRRAEADGGGRRVGHGHEIMTRSILYYIDGMTGLVTVVGPCHQATSACHVSARIWSRVPLC